MTVRSLLTRGLDFLLPPGCVGCGGPAGPPESARAHAPLLCARCRTRLRPPPPPCCPRCHAPLGTRPMNPGSNACRECVEWPGALARVRSTTVLAPPADAIVHALKYGGWPEVAEPLARLMRSDLEALVDSAGGPGGPRIGGFGGPVLVPVPTTPGRLRQRGYNQAARLAEALARLTGMPSLEALLRIERGGSQVALQREERRANVRGAFRIRDFASRRLSGRPVILVDDVLTTGATACEAAEVLTTAGAGTVRLLVFARTLPGRTPDLVPGSAPATGFFHAAIRRRSSRDRRRTETRTGGS